MHKYYFCYVSRLVNAGNKASLWAQEMFLLVGRKKMAEGAAVAEACTPLFENLFIRQMPSQN